MNGKVQSKGFGYPGLNLTLAHNGTAGASTGGSINITAGTLSGNGEIDADGGSDELGGNGSGGRIRVKLTAQDATFDDNSVNMHARGGSGDGPKANVVDAAAGTIALQTAADGGNAGTVVIKNRVRMLNNVPVPVGATHFPSMQDGDASLSGVRLEIATDARVFLTRDARIKSIEVDGTVLRNGSYSAAQLNALFGTSQFSGNGVVSMGSGFAIIVK